MAHDASQNNPKKEIAQALIGVVLLFTMIGGIAVSAWLRPAGDHTPATVSATPAGQALESTLKSLESSKSGAETAK